MGIYQIDAEGADAQNWNHVKVNRPRYGLALMVAEESGKSSRAGATARSGGCRRRREDRCCDLTSVTLYKDFDLRSPF